MSSKPPHFVPVTCKQLQHIHSTDGQCRLGYQNVSTVVLVGFVVEASVEGSKTTLDIEDTTGLVRGLECFHLTFPIDPFQYVEVVLTVSTSQNEGETLKYIQAVRLIEDSNQITSHLLQAYAYHLRCCLSEPPLPTHKQHLKHQQDQQQLQNGGTMMNGGMNAFGQQPNSFAQSFTGLSNTNNMGGNTSSNNSGMVQVNSHVSPSEAILSYLQSQSHITDGLTVTDIERALHLPHSVDIKRVIDSLLDDGAVFTSIDDYHFSAC